MISRIIGLHIKFLTDADPKDLKNLRTIDKKILKLFTLQPLFTLLYISYSVSSVNESGNFKTKSDNSRTSLKENYLQCL